MQPEPPGPARSVQPPSPSPGLTPGGRDLAGADPDRPEQSLIEHFLAGRGPRPAWLRVDAGHDCAVVDGGTALKVDAVVGGVHFDDRWTAREVGWKAVANVLSDLGAAGARPTWLLVAVSAADPGWARGVADGVAELAARAGAYLVGGDVTRVPPGAPPVVSVSGGGRCLGRPRTRAGVAPGDVLWVTGTLGLAGLGWWDPSAPPEALAALRRPDPPLAFALALAERSLAVAAMDVSDGLASDVPRLARASGVALRVDPARLPLAPAVAAHPDGARLALGGGDDLELLFAARPGAEPAIRALAARHGVSVTPIGVAEAGTGARLLAGGWPGPLFSHFGEVP